MIFPGTFTMSETCLKCLLTTATFRIHGRDEKAARLLEGSSSCTVLLLLLLYAIWNHRLLLSGTICFYPAQLGFPE